MLGRFEAEDEAVVLLCVHPRQATGFDRSHDFCLDPMGRITRDYGAPVIYGGVALLGKSWFADTPDGAFPLTEIFETALEREKLFGVALDADWYHVGDPKALAETERLLAR